MLHENWYYFTGVTPAQLCEAYSLIHRVPESKITSFTLHHLIFFHHQLLVLYERPAAASVLTNFRFVGPEFELPFYDAIDEMNRAYFDAHFYKQLFHLDLLAQDGPLIHDPKGMPLPRWQDTKDLPPNMSTTTKTVYILASRQGKLNDISKLGKSIVDWDKAKHDINSEGAGLPNRSLNLAFVFILQGHDEAMDGKSGLERNIGAHWASLEKTGARACKFVSEEVATRVLEGKVPTELIRGGFERCRTLASASKITRAVTDNELLLDERTTRSAQYSNVPNDQHYPTPPSNISEFALEAGTEEAADPPTNAANDL